MVELKRFREVNKLTQAEVADYLGVGQGFVSQMEKGDRKVPDAAIEKIMNNPHGWDTSMLMQKSSISMSGTNFVGVAGDVHNGEGRTEQYIKSLQDTIARLVKGEGRVLGTYSQTHDKVNHSLLNFT